MAVLRRARQSSRHPVDELTTLRLCDPAAVIEPTSGFELQGHDGDETRLLVHAQLGYSVAIAGRPVMSRPSAELPTYDVVIQLQDAPVELGFRMDEVPTQIRIPALVTASLITYAQMRATGPVGRLRIDAVEPPLLAPGAICTLHAVYGLKGNDAAAMEFLAITAKRCGRDTPHLMHMSVRFRAGDFSPFSFSNLWPALLAHQSWQPGELPSTHVWPANPRFARPQVKLELTDAAFEVARKKAALIGEISPKDVNQLADYLLSEANRKIAPSAPWNRDLDLPVARAIASSLPTEFAEVLLRDLSEVQTAHDYRGWLWQNYWAVGNRAGLRRN
jgi:hypothetical protein